METPDYSKRIPIKGFPNYYVIGEDIWLLLPANDKRDAPIEQKQIPSPKGNICLKKEDGSPLFYNYENVVKKIREKFNEDPESFKEKRNENEEPEELVALKMQRLSLQSRCHSILEQAKKAKGMAELIDLKAIHEEAEAKLKEFDELHPEAIPEHVKNRYKKKEKTKSVHEYAPEIQKEINQIKTAIDAEMSKLNLLLIEREELRKSLNEKYGSWKKVYSNLFIDLS